MIQSTTSAGGCVCACACAWGCVCVYVCLCVCTLGEEKFGNRGRSHVSWLPWQHCPQLWASHCPEPLGTLRGQLLRPSQTLLGFLELISLGNKMKLWFSAELASCAAQKSHHTSLKEHEKSMASLPVSAIRPAIPRTPISVGPACSERPWMEASCRHHATTGLYPIWGHELLGFFNPPHGRGKKAKS